jgi:mevalonate kinase
MPVIYTKAPGKIILFGEHAVVYGQPAIAIPVNKVNATARVFPTIDAQADMVRIQAPDINFEACLADLPPDHPFAAAIRLAMQFAGVDRPPAYTLVITSTIPISAGMGSSAAIAIAIIRAITGFLGKPITADETSALAYEVEKIQHGSPSGIDNHVIAHQKPIFFSRNEPIQPLAVEQTTHWVIADTGEKTPTRVTVAEVHHRHTADPETYNQIFMQIGEITRQARQSLITGDLAALGFLMDQNQHLLDLLGVSSPSLEHLIHTAREAGAAGAKLSGGGRGGNIIALSSEEKTRQIETALLTAGATRVITTALTKGGPR